MADILDEAFDAMWGAVGILLQGVAASALLLALVALSPIWLPLFAFRRLTKEKHG